MSEEILIGILEELRKQNRTSREIWDLEDIADYLKLAVNSVARRVVTIEGFPIPVQLPTSEKGGHKRWYANEVKQWVRRFKGTISQGAARSH
ncbi:hypothetical protein O4H49_12845 [Kiloniella laminariae]|uniref:Uncharacterized protein n=1 Tax=Kiloniella laminariae TaxID=454162 RepID=A0ABT4LL45_9PROT|nr:hypothetical protein [Kiloniella laminariae]MCZ4281670.1 hypothetical protein [Kiloniella laminariae]